MDESGCPFALNTPPRFALLFVHSSSPVLQPEQEWVARRAKRKTVSLGPTFCAGQAAKRRGLSNGASLNATQSTSCQQCIATLHTSGCGERVSSLARPCRFEQCPYLAQTRPPQSPGGP